MIYGAFGIGRIYAIGATPAKAVTAAKKAVPNYHGIWCVREMSTLLAEAWKSSNEVAFGCHLGVLKHPSELRSHAMQPGPMSYFAEKPSPEWDAYWLQYHGPIPEEDDLLEATHSSKEKG